MGLFFACLASFFASFNNYAQRRSIDIGGSCKGFIVIQLFSSFLVMMLLNPLGIDSVGKEVCCFGIFGGIILGLLTWGIGKTLEHGPPGLTFAIFSSASFVPAFFFFLFFGPSFGYSFTLWNIGGSLLVILGLFLAARQSVQIRVGRWKYFMTFAFAAHALFLGFLALWALILRGEHPLFSSFLIPSSHRGWFMPIMLLTAAMMQLGLFLFEKRLPHKKEVFYGMGGGVCHGLCTYFLILAPQKAAFWENAMLFPTYAVLIILICNGWAQLIYKEKVHWKANAIAFAGIVLGALG